MGGGIEKIGLYLGTEMDQLLDILGPEEFARQFPESQAVKIEEDERRQRQERAVLTIEDDIVQTHRMITEEIAALSPKERILFLNNNEEEPRPEEYVAAAAGNRAHNQLSIYYQDPMYKNIVKEFLCRVPGDTPVMGVERLLKLRQQTFLSTRREEEESLTAPAPGQAACKYGSQCAGLQLDVDEPFILTAYMPRAQRDTMTDEEYRDTISQCPCVLDHRRMAQEIMLDNIVENVHLRVDNGTSTPVAAMKLATIRNLVTENEYDSKYCILSPEHGIYDPIVAYCIHNYSSYRDPKTGRLRLEQLVPYPTAQTYTTPAALGVLGPPPPLPPDIAASHAKIQSNRGVRPSTTQDFR